MCSDGAAASAGVGGDLYWADLCAAYVRSQYGFLYGDQGDRMCDIKYTCQILLGPSHIYLAWIDFIQHVVWH